MDADRAQIDTRHVSTRKYICVHLRLSAVPFWFCLLLGLACGAACAEPTGRALPGLESYDEFMLELIRKWDIAGASLAIARKDKLALARGYGFADRDRNVPVEPSSLFRLASLSKTVTAVAVLRLAQDGRVKLDYSLQRPQKKYQPRKP
jgi:CubicO group peptidase (beta-lactamase class C family)